MSSRMNIFRSDKTLNRAFLLLNVNRKVFYIQIFCILKLLFLTLREEKEGKEIIGYNFPPPDETRQAKTVVLRQSVLL